MVDYLYIVPQWFFGLSIGLELIFGVAAGIVAAYSYKVYRLSGQRESKLFAWSFMAISFSYLIKAMLNLFVLREVKEGLREFTMRDLNAIGSVGLYLHIFLFVTGLMTLTYMSFRIRNTRSYILLVAMGTFMLFFSSNLLVAYNILSSLLILYISFHYYSEYRKNNNHKTLLVLIAFMLLFFAGIGSVAAEDFYANFVIGHILELASYMLIVTSLVLTIRKR